MEEIVDPISVDSNRTVRWLIGIRMVLRTVESGGGGVGSDVGGGIAGLHLRHSNYLKISPSLLLSFFFFAEPFVVRFLISFFLVFFFSFLFYF